MTKKTKNKKKNKKTRSSSNPQKSHKELIIKKELLKQAISKSNTR